MLLGRVGVVWLMDGHRKERDEVETTEKAQDWGGQV